MEKDWSMIKENKESFYERWKEQGDYYCYFCGVNLQEMLVINANNYGKLRMCKVCLLGKE